MNARVLDEPELEFAAGGRHIDPRTGLADYGPADSAQPSRVIRVGIVGEPSSIEGVRHWLERCADGIEARETRLIQLFPAFPGCHADAGFRAELVFNARWERSLRPAELNRIATAPAAEAVRDAVELYLTELAALDEEPDCDVVICARPDVLPERDEEDDTEYDGPPALVDGPRPLSVPDFHDLLKARAMRFRQPIQLIRRSTWDPTYKPRTSSGEKLQLQDEASRAWNLFTALYYKAGGVPWRLTRRSDDYAVCYVGVSFYETQDGSSLHTSVAQVFNQRGDGMIVRGAPAQVSATDRQPHLNQADAAALLTDTLTRYRAEHGTAPARVVIHKSSAYTEAELVGLRTAAASAQLGVLELVWMPVGDSLRLYRSGYHPPLRGTMLSFDADRHHLYTVGSVPFYRTYPGLYVPRPLPIRCVDTESSPTALATEILALTKMNWNQTRLDGRRPITLRTADRVGNILRHVPAGDRVAHRYAHYM